MFHRISVHLDLDDARTAVGRRQQRSIRCGRDRLPVCRRTAAAAASAAGDVDGRPGVQSPAVGCRGPAAGQVLGAAAERIAQVRRPEGDDASAAGGDAFDGDDASAALGPLHRLAPLEHLLTPHLVLVELGEVVDDDGDRQRDDQHAADTARRADQLAPPGLGIDVAVADRRHGDRRPPERLRDADELGLLDLLLGEVRQAGKDENADGDEHHEKSEFLVAATQGVAERLQPDRVARQLQYPQYAHDAEDLHDAADVVEMVGALARLVQSERHVVGQDGEQVDGVQGALEELALARRRPQPDDVLEGEPGDAGGFQVDEVLVVLVLALVVDALQRRQGVERQADHGHHDEQDGDQRNNLSASINS